MLHTKTPAYRSRPDGWTLKAQRTFIAALAETGSVVAAARIAGRTPSAAYKLRGSGRSELFRSAWAAAMTTAYARLHDLAMDRVENGVELPTTRQGEVVAIRKAYSDRLLIAMLDRLDPDRKDAPILNAEEDAEASLKEFIDVMNGRLAQIGDEYKAKAERRARALANDPKDWLATIPE